MRSQVIAVFVLLSSFGLATTSCNSGNDESSTSSISTSGEGDDLIASNTTTPPSTMRPAITTSSTIPDSGTTTSPSSDTDTPDDSIIIVGTGTGRPPAPTNLRCLAGVAAGELLLEWDAPEDTTNINEVRLYVSNDGGPFIANSTIPLSQVDTTRADGTRWAAPVREVPADKPLRIAVTTFNALGNESGWHPMHAHYVGPGEACGSGVPTPPVTTTTLLSTVCTAGC